MNIGRKWVNIRLSLRSDLLLFLQFLYEQCSDNRIIGSNAICFLIALWALCKIVHGALYIKSKCSFSKSVLSWKWDVAIITYFWRWFRVANATSDNIVNVTQQSFYRNDLNNDVVTAKFFQRCLKTQANLAVQTFKNNSIIFFLQSASCSSFFVDTLNFAILCFWDVEHPKIAQLLQTKRNKYFKI